MAKAKKRSRGHKKRKGSKGGSSKVAKISRLAKKIRKPGEKWTNTIKRASKQVQNMEID